MTVGTFYAPKIFAFMMNIASEYGIPIKEVETALIREGLKSIGFECEHIRMGIRKTDNKSNCKDCWQLFRQIKAPRYNAQKELVELGQYVKEPTFLEEKKGHKDETVYELQGQPPRRQYHYKSETVPAGLGDSR
jgi:hypothetical protein